jgi:hypothetical protein
MVAMVSMLDSIFSAASDALQAAVLTAFVTLQEDCTSSSTTKGGGLRGGGEGEACDDGSSSSSSSGDGSNGSDEYPLKLLLPTTTTTTAVTVQQQLRLLSYHGSTTLADRVEESIPDTEEEANTYYKMWVGWAAIFAFCGIVSFCIWLAIFMSKKANKSPFNVRIYTF